MPKIRFDFTHRGRVARLALSAPKANIISGAMIADLEAACDRLTKEDAGLAAIVIGSDGPHFSFGASIEEHLPEHIENTLSSLHRLLRRIANLPAPTIAAIRGQCLGGGLELALACDLIVAEEDAQLGCPEVTLGVFPPAASVLLPVRLGVARAAALVLTGRSICGREAATIGLAAHVTPHGTLDAFVDDWVTEAFVPRSAAALRFATAAMRSDVRRALDIPLGEAERLYLDDLMKESDAVEGIRAFLARRAPRWASAVSG